MARQRTSDGVLTAERWVCQDCGLIMEGPDGYLNHIAFCPTAHIVPLHELMVR